jgi:NAD(P)-dependent dehydrogenase (short-subunit alcohol dehydrogenase family)
VFPEPHHAVIVGAGGAIGRATCRVFAEAGASLWALDLDERAASEAVAGLPGGHQSRAVNVSDAVAIAELAVEICRERSVDSVVYAPGLVFTADVATTEWASYRQLMAVNLDGAFYCAQAFVRPMLAAKRAGSFVFISSMAGKRGEAGASAYCASKFGLIGMVESFAAETAASGIRVNAVCPGNVDSPMLRKVVVDIATREGREAETVWHEMAEVAAAKRLVSPGEVAAVCLWLCSSAASAVTGEAINVDAGALSG